MTHTFTSYKHAVICALAFGVAGWFLPIAATAQTVSSSGQISTSTLKQEISEFTSHEIAAHFGSIKTLDPPPERVFGALTVGGFS